MAGAFLGPVLGTSHSLSHLYRTLGSTTVSILLDLVAALGARLTDLSTTSGAVANFLDNWRAHTEFGSSTNDRTWCDKSFGRSIGIVCCTVDLSFLNDCGLITWSHILHFLNPLATAWI